MSLRVKCDSCDACVINGVACHETGCRRSRNHVWVQEGNYLVPVKAEECPHWDYENQLDECQEC